MQSIDIHTLPRKLAEILRQIRENGETVDITDQGEVVARLIPQKKRTPQQIADALASLKELERIASEIDWPEGVNAVDVMRDVRRDL